MSLFWFVGIFRAGLRGRTWVECKSLVNNNFNARLLVSQELFRDAVNAEKPVGDHWRLPVGDEMRCVEDQCGSNG